VGNAKDMNPFQYWNKVQHL